MTQPCHEAPADSGAGFPRTLLLTWWAPDTAYKNMRKIVDRLPDGSVAWCSLRPARPEARFPFPHVSAAPRGLHYRFDRTALGQWLLHEAQADSAARRLAEWARPFRPEVVWVLPEMGAARAGRLLARRLGVPLHATAHDAHETARFIVPPLYYPFYAHSVRRLFAAADSADAICAPMRDYLARRHANLAGEACIVFLPSIGAETMVLPAPEPADDGVRRIAFCGSMRVSVRQWKDFLAMLARLPHAFELILFAYADLFPSVPLPANVRTSFEPFADDEAGVVQTFVRRGAHAGYVGLWKDRSQRIFGQTSFSQKLVTYAAAGLPAIVDAGADSSAWALVDRYRAGVLCGDDPGAALAELGRFMSDSAYRAALREGARRMCRAEFDLDANTARLGARLTRTAAGGIRRA